MMLSLSLAASCLVAVSTIGAHPSSEQGRRRVGKSNGGNYMTEDPYENPRHSPLASLAHRHWGKAEHDVKKIGAKHKKAWNEHDPYVPWEDDPYQEHEPDPSKDYDPMYPETDPWEEEPCVPAYQGSWSEYAYDDMKGDEHGYAYAYHDSKDDEYDHGYASSATSPSSSYDEHDYGSRDLEYDEHAYSKWLEKVAHEEEYWDEYEEKKPKGTKTPKGAKGEKGTKAKGHKPDKYHNYPYPHKPKHPYMPKPCPTKAPTKAPTKEPYYGSGSHYESGSDTHHYEPYPETQRQDELIVELTPFKIEFKVRESRYPTEEEIKDIEGATMDLLQDYFVDVFVHKSGATLDFVDVAVPEEKKPQVHHYMITVFFRAKVYFDGYSHSIPTRSQLDILLKHAFWGNSLHDFHHELTMLPKDSVFYSATVASVSTVSLHNDYNGEQQWRPGDYSYQTHKPKATEEETHDQDLVPHEDSPETQTVSSGPLPDTKSTSSSLTPPVMVVTIISSTTFVMSALFFVLYRQKALKEKQQRQLRNQFPPPKNDGSVAEVTAIMEEEDSMVECELGDEDFGSVSSDDSRFGKRARSRAENFLRMMEDDDNRSTGRPRRFLVANASRKGNTWTQ